MIKILAFGKFKDKNMENLASFYLKKINKYHKTEIIELVEETKRDLKANLLEEANKLEHLFDNKSYNILLSPQGEQITSEKFSEIINQSFNQFPKINFIIGSSSGVDEKIVNKANRVISFSKLTFPHLLFRVMLLEQVYRAFKIIGNERYHK